MSGLKNTVKAAMMGAVLVAAGASAIADDDGASEFTPEDRPLVEMAIRLEDCFRDAQREILLPPRAEGETLEERQEKLDGRYVVCELDVGMTWAQSADFYKWLTERYGPDILNQMLESLQETPKVEGVCTPFSGCDHKP